MNYNEATLNVLLIDIFNTVTDNNYTIILNLWEITISSRAPLYKLFLLSFATPPVSDIHPGNTCLVLRSSQWIFFYIRVLLIVYRSYHDQSWWLGNSSWTRETIKILSSELRLIEMHYSTSQFLHLLPNQYSTYCHPTPFRISIWLVNTRSG